jgi:hypothetical protein
MSPFDLMSPSIIVPAPIKLIDDCAVEFLFAAGEVSFSVLLNIGFNFGGFDAF